MTEKDCLSVEPRNRDVVFAALSKSQTSDKNRLIREAFIRPGPRVSFVQVSHVLSSVQLCIIIVR